MKVVMCKAPGCNKMVINDPSFCPHHRALSEQRKKQNAFKNATRYANYDSHEWRKLRYKILTEHPYCANCGIDKYNAELHVHHITPVRDDPTKFLDETNLIVLCESCHATQTQKEITSRH